MAPDISKHDDVCDPEEAARKRPRLAGEPSLGPSSSSSRKWPPARRAKFGQGPGSVIALSSASSAKAPGTSKDQSRDNSIGSLRHTCRDGRACKLCNTKDGEQDDVVKTELWYWAYPPKNGKPDGWMCYVCLRVYNSRYQIKFPSTDALVQKMGGTDASLLTEFKSWRAYAVEQMIKACICDLCRISNLLPA